MADGRVFATGRARPGRSLADVLAAQGPLAPARADALVDQVTSALEALEASGVHGLLPTPSSVLVTVDGGSEHVYLAPLETGTDEATPAALAAERLHETMRVAQSSGAAGARGASAPARPRRRLRASAALAALAVVAAGAATLLLASRGSDDAPSPPRLASASAPVARLVARIPLGAAPAGVGSVAFGAGSVWVVTDKGTLLRIDPRTNRVVGAPTRYGPAGKLQHVTVAVGNGSVWVAQESTGTLTRVDPGSGRVTARRRLGGALSGLAVAAGHVAVTRTAAGADGIASSRLQLLDPGTLRPVGPGVRVGRQPWRVTAAPGRIWVTAFDGTVARLDTRTGAVTRMRAASTGIAAGLRGGRPWITDYFGQTVTPVHADALALPATFARVAHPAAMAVTRDAVWTVSITGDDPSGPGRLVRIDPGTGRVVGRALDVGRGTGELAVGDGALWVGSADQRALLRVAPSSPVAALHGPSGSDTRRVLAPGPLASGSWRSAGFVAPFHVSLPDATWLAGPPEPTQLQLARSRDDFTGVLVAAPRTFFTRGERPRPVGAPERLMRLLSAKAGLRVGAPTRTTVGGRPALTATVRVTTARQYPDLCAEPCIPVFGFAVDTIVLTRSSAVRLTALRVHGRTVIVLEEVPRSGHLGVTGAVVRTLRFD